VPRHRRMCGGWLLMGGTLTKESSGLAGVSTCWSAWSFGVWWVVVEHRWWGGGACRAHCWVLRSPATGWWGAWYGPVLGSRTARSPVGGGVGGSGGGRGRWLFENCTVDASIFVKIKTHPLGCGSWFSAVLLFLLKFLRAQGGCLGTRSRRRTW
jgi:hypothetical protein